MGEYSALATARITSCRVWIDTPPAAQDIYADRGGFAPPAHLHAHASATRIATPTATPGLTPSPRPTWRLRPSPMCRPRLFCRAGALAGLPAIVAGYGAGTFRPAIPDARAAN